MAGSTGEVLERPEVVGRLHHVPLEVLDVVLKLPHNHETEQPVESTETKRVHGILSCQETGKCGLILIIYRN